MDVHTLYHPPNGVIYNAPNTCMDRGIEIEIRKKKHELQRIICESRSYKDWGRIASETVNIEVSIRQKYQFLHLEEILHDNSSIPNTTLNKIEECLRLIIEKYGKHLLLPPDQRQSDWKMIRFKNDTFENQVDNIKGARLILYDLGYTRTTKAGLVFPQDEPVKEELAPLMAELLMAHHELIAYNVGTHRAPHLFEEIIPMHMRKSPQVVGPHRPDHPVPVYPGQSGMNGMGCHFPTPALHHQPDLHNGFDVVRRTVSPEVEKKPIPSTAPEGPWIPTVVGEAITLDSLEAQKVRAEVILQSIPGLPGIPNLPIFGDEEEQEQSLKSVAAAPVVVQEELQQNWKEPPKMPSPRTVPNHTPSPVVLDPLQKHRELADLCRHLEQKLDEIDQKEGDIIKRSSDFFLSSDYRVIRVERRNICDLLTKAKNDLDLLDIPIVHAPVLTPQTQEMHAPLLQPLNPLLVNVSRPPSRYVPRSESRISQPAGDPSSSPNPYLAPSGSSEIKCPLCNVTVRGGKDCFLCGMSLLHSEPESSGKWPGPGLSPGGSNTSPHSGASSASINIPKIGTAIEQQPGWECQHCSFLNTEPKGRKDSFVCQVCAKTNDNVMQVIDEPMTSSILSDLQQKEFDKLRPGGKKLKHQTTDPTSDTSGPTLLSPSRSPPKRSQSEILPKPEAKPGGSTCVSIGGSRPEEFAESAKIDEMVASGKALIQALRDCEKEDFTPCEFDLAYQRLGGNSEAVLPWLLNTWRPMLAEVRARVSQMSLTICEEGARQALLEAKGDINRGTELAIHYTLEKIDEVKQYGPFQEEQVQEELAATGGNVMETVKRLTKRVLVEFTRRIADAIDQPPLTDASLTCDVADGDSEGMERRLRMLFAEFNLTSWGRAELVHRLIKHSRQSSNSEEDWSNITLEDMVEAVEDLGNFRSALTHLQQQCQVCFITISKNKMRSLVCCECNVCTDCLRQHFEIRVRERHVREWVCPVCSGPDIDDEERRDQHFQFMDCLLKGVVAPDVFSLFEDKLRDWTLMNDPKFRWCAHCDFGHFYEDDTTQKMTCPKCNKHTCFECRRPWEDQHEGISCEEFASWKETNDPEVQQLGLAKILAESGIDCPACKFRYALAKGGCMHFKCIQCRHEFCSGCLRSFKRGNPTGLHCDHPRDCLFYMRDYEVNELQKLLRDHGIAYNTNDPSEGKGGEGASAVPAGVCPVMIQKEVPDGLKDEACGSPVLENDAGLCGLHYKEYLVGLINKNLIDPIEIMHEEQLMRVLQRHHRPVPPKKKKETPAVYELKLKQMIQKEFPLQKPAGRVAAAPALPPAGAGAAAANPGNVAGAAAGRIRNGPVGIRSVPVENVEEAIQYI